LRYKGSESGDLDVETWNDLLAPLRRRFRTKTFEAEELPHGVMRNARLGALTGLDDNGCFEGATAICSSCYKCLRSKKANGVPKNALINGTWQGIIPACLRFKSEASPDGLNLVELSMICLYSPISYLTMLKGGACFASFCERRLHRRLNILIRTAHRSVWENTIHRGVSQ